VFPQEQKKAFHSTDLKTSSFKKSFQSFTARIFEKTLLLFSCKEKLHDVYADTSPSNQTLMKPFLKCRKHRMRKLSCV